MGGGWGETKIKAKLSPAEAGAWAELGNNPKIVDTISRCNAQGQHTHFAQSNCTVTKTPKKELIRAPLIDTDETYSASTADPHLPPNQAGAVPVPAPLELAAPAASLPHNEGVPPAHNPHPKEAVPAAPNFPPNEADPADHSIPPNQAVSAAPILSQTQLPLQMRRQDRQ